MTAFRNPVVRGFAPHPSVCRVGDDFFMATSSFEFLPAIPIRHSTDLVHREVIGHAVSDASLLRPDRRAGPFVLFAPTLRQHQGQFFVACTNMAPRVPAEGRASGFTGNFIVHANDPAGPWSEPVWVDTEGFDPSLTFADDTCYYTRRTLDFSSGAAGHGPISATHEGREVLAGSGAAKLLGAEVAPGYGSVGIGLFAYGDGRDAATFVDVKRESVE